MDCHCYLGNLVRVLSCCWMQVVAGTFNVVKAGRFYGRYWGAFETVKNLHFEACCELTRRKRAGSLVSHHQTTATWYSLFAWCSLGVALQALPTYLFVASEVTHDTASTATIHVLFKDSEQLARPLLHQDWALNVCSTSE